MLLETLLSAALEAGFGLIAEAGFGDSIRDLRDRLTSATERRRRDALERAFARAREAVGDDPIKPLIEHRPFFEEIVKAFLDPRSGFDVEAVGEVWQDRLPEHDRALRQFFSHLEAGLFADDTWGPILDRFQALRHQKEVSQALQARNLDIPAQKVVHEVSLRLRGSGGMATEGGVAAGVGGVAVAGDVGQIVLQQFIMQSGAPAGSANLRQRYLSRLRLHCCNLPLDALGGNVDPQKRVTLDQVYIDLNTTTSVPANILEQIQEGRMTRWAEVENALRATPDGPLREDHLRNQGAGERNDARRPLPALDALRLSPYVTFLGDPGAGKSTFVRVVMARAIDGTPPAGVSTELLPVLVVLRGLVQRLVSIDLDALPGDRHAVALATAVRDQMIADLLGLEAEGFGADLREALKAHRRLVPHMVTLLTSDLTAPERCQAGEVLGQFGDPSFQAEAWYLPDEPLLGFVEIPAGPFLMGSDQARDPDAVDNEHPQHEITLSRYFMAQYPVTVAQFRAFVDVTEYQPGDEDCLRGVPNHPVVSVSWHEARRYCAWLSEQLRLWEGTTEPLASLLRHQGWQVTLPSEAEWEKAARGTDGQFYPWGSEPDPNRANYADTGINTTSAVECFPGGASPYLIEDLSGNVWEWTRSLWEQYPDPTDENAQAQGENLDAGSNEAQVWRGGAFNLFHWNVRCAYRFRDNPYNRGRSIGFRLVVRSCR